MEQDPHPEREIPLKPSWDPAAGRLTRPAFAPSVLGPLNTPYRRKLAATQSANAAWIIAFLNGLTIPFVLGGHGAARHTMIGADPTVLASAQLLAALIACYLALRAHRRPSPRLALLILAWSIIEAVPWIPLTVYGHAIGGRMYAVVAMALVAALIGVRGAWALRRAEASTPSA
jgi:hypothetical protein